MVLMKGQLLIPANILGQRPPAFVTSENDSSSSVTDYTLRRWATAWHSRHSPSRADDGDLAGFSPAAVS